MLYLSLIFYQHNEHNVLYRYFSLLLLFLLFSIQFAKMKNGTSTEPQWRLALSRISLINTDVSSRVIPAEVIQYHITVSQNNFYPNSVKDNRKVLSCKILSLFTFYTLEATLHILIGQKCIPI